MKNKPTSHVILPGTGSPDPDLWSKGLGTEIGLGDPTAWLKIYIGNQPTLPDGHSWASLQPMVENELERWLAVNSNHWRKIFNITAKLMFDLCPEHFSNWQDYRDGRLLQQGSGHALLFSPISTPTPLSALRIITGKSYAQESGLLAQCDLLSDGFYLNTERRLLVTPYFDYRQLSNAKLDYLSDLVQSLSHLQY